MEINIGDKVKLTTGHIVAITNIIKDEVGEVFEGNDVENGIFNSFLKDSIVGKEDD